MKDDSKKPTRAEQIRDDERFSSVADAAPVMLWVTEPDSAVSFLSRAQHQCVLFFQCLDSSYCSYLCWLVLRPFVGVLLWAIVLVVVFYPVHRRLAAWTGRPATAAALSTLLVIVTILLPVVLVTLAVAHELRGAVEQAQGGLGRVLDIPAIQPAVRWLDQYVDVDAWRSSEYVADHLQAWSAAIAGPTLLFVGGILNALVQTLLVVFTLFYFFRDADSLRDAIYEIVAARVRPVARHHDPHARRHRRDDLRRAGDFCDPGRARHAHLLRCWACRRRCSGAS